MSKKTIKTAAMVLVCGTVFQLGGCLGSALGSLWQNLPITLLTEFALDNNGIFDVFPDGP